MTHLLYVSYAAVLEVNRQLANALARLDVKVTVVVPEEVSVAAAQHCVEPSSAGLDIVALPRQSGSRTLRFVGLERLVWRTRPNAVLIEADPGTLLVQQVLFAAIPRRIPVACTSCEVVPRNFPREALSELRHGRALTGLRFATGAALEALQLRSLDAMFCYGPIPAEIFRRVKGYTGQIIETPLGVDTQTFAFSPNPQRDPRLTVAYMGRMARPKSIETVVDACADLTPRPRLMIDELYWQDDVAYRDEIRARIQAAGFTADEVEYFNPHHREVPAFLRRADVVVLASRRVGNVVEQYGRAIAEAMAMGKPVIVTRSGHLPYLVGDAGAVVEEGDATGIAQAVEKLRRPAHYDEMSKRAYTRARDYLSAEVHARKVIEWLVRPSA